MSEEIKTPEVTPTATIAPAAPPPSPAREPGPKKGRFPQQRFPKEPVRSPERQQVIPKPPSLRELDAEIEGELEAALTGLSQKDLLAADTSNQAQQQAGSSPGEHGRKQGKVLSIHGQDVFVEVPGGRSQGILPLEQFPDGPPKPGTEVDINIEGYADGNLILSRRGAAVTADWSTVAEGMTVEARVIETNKGGLAVDVNGLRGFMPISQIELFRVEQTEQFVNQKLLCLVTEVNPQERNLVVSRRALLDKEREEQREKLWLELAEGQIREGIIRSVRDFGAFVDLGGADGLLHVSEMSWKRVADPTTIVQPGQKVRVAVLKVDHEARKISLGLKQLETSPWDNIGEKYQSMQVIEGTVTRVMDFGAFVELEPGVEGLVHVSELAGKRVWRVSDVIKPGEKVQAKILHIDPEQQRISLSLKAVHAVEAPPTDEEEEADTEPAKPPRPRTTPLRGGIGEASFKFEEVPE